MTGISKLEGMPVMVSDEKEGHVQKVILTRDGRAVRGMVIRSGMQGMRWLDREQISMVGNVCVIANSSPGKLPKDADYHLFRVSDAEGERLGMVTDAIINEETMRVAALEISSGPLDDLIHGRWYATAFSVLPGEKTGHVTVFCDGRGVKQ